ncbi:UNVERIFIED_CONTAM: hypothetical protein Sradi_3064100 [Sesamum radiatum]|uniref:Uncharacterized protein n=1 Tax=Sesamum radiatum TaxID=300843 RepID=A0AAW2RBU5_SESRA
MEVRMMRDRNGNLKDLERAIKELNEKPVEGPNGTPLYKLQDLERAIKELNEKQ